MSWKISKISSPNTGSLTITMANQKNPKLDAISRIFTGLGARPARVSLHALTRNAKVMQTVRISHPNRNAANTPGFTAGAPAL